MCVFEKEIIDVEEHQKNLYDLNGIQPLEEEMTFYYDESGNGRKFSLGSDGFNDPDAFSGDFILGGVAHEGKSFPIDECELRNALNFNKTQKEMKFKHLYSKSDNFISFINSDKATNFLNWLSKSGLYIHYTQMNRLYYSLVDIVDSLWDGTNYNYIDYHWNIKEALYNFANEHRNEITELLIKHTYPCVKDVSVFCRELRLLIKKYRSTHISEIFCNMLEHGETLNTMPFIQGMEMENNKSNRLTLISEYHILYLQKCEEFSKSRHIFDEEPRVKEKMEKIQLLEGGKPLNNWVFVNSCENVFVQVSDMVVGLLRKLYYYLDDHTMEEIRSVHSTLNEVQIKNFWTIYNLISKSDNKHTLLFKNIIPHTYGLQRMCKLMVLSGLLVP